jgi:hypothetical protein
VREIWGVFLCMICFGSHTWRPCASFLGDISPPNPREGLRFWWFPWFLELMISRPRIRDSLWLRALWRGRPGGDLDIPKISLQSVGWIGRSIDGSWGLTQTRVSRGGSNCPRSVRRKFWFPPRFSISMLALTRGSYGWNIGEFWARLGGFQLSS